MNPRTHLEEKSGSFDAMPFPGLLSGLSMPRRQSISTSLLLLLTLAATLPALALGPKPPHRPKIHVHDQIMLLENQWRDAQLKGDVSAMDKLLSEDFLGITGNGQVVTKAQQLDRMKSRTLMLSKVDVSDVKIKILGQGQAAIATSFAQIEGSTDGTPINGAFRYTHVFQRMPNGTWKLTSFEATRVPKNLGPGHQTATAGGTSPSPEPQR